MSLAQEPVVVRPAVPADRDAVVGILTDAFADDPVNCWAYPEPAERRAAFPGFCRQYLDQPEATADLIDSAGAAIWVRHGSVDGPADADTGPDAAEPPVRTEAGRRLMTLGSALAPFHPRQPYWYLFSIGVLGSSRGTGRGTALLRFGLDRADRDRTGCYLEASSTGSHDLYRRHGFSELTDRPVRADDAPPVWPMWREPATTSP